MWKPVTVPRSITCSTPPGNTGIPFPAVHPVPSKKNMRSFLHNIDSCRAVLELMASTSALDGTVYNVATDEEVSIIDLVKLIADKLNIAEPIIKFEGYRASDPERRILDTDKIRKRTNWKPVVSLSEGLDMCVQNLSKYR